MRIRILPRPFHAWVTVNGIAVAGNAIISDLNKNEHRASIRKIVCNWGCGISIIAVFSSHGLSLLGLLVFALARIVPARRVSIKYEVDALFSAWHGYLLDVWPDLAGTGGHWLIQHRMPVYGTHEWKVNAGANTLLTRLPAKFQTTAPRPLKVNLPAPTVTAGPHCLVLLPDQALMRAGKNWSRISYGDLAISHLQTRYIEGLPPPHDGIVVGQTWRYTNVNGTPDRRFNNNFLLPVMLYSEIRLTSATGFDWAMHISQQGPTARWAAILANHPCFLAGG